MNTLINCFVPKGIEEETKRNVDALGNLDLVGEVTVIDGDVRDSKTVHRIADEAGTRYTLVFLKNSYIRMGYLALEPTASARTLPSSTTSRAACATTSTSAPSCSSAPTHSKTRPAA